MDSTVVNVALPVIDRELDAGLVVFGIGLASTVAPLTDTVISAVSERRSGIAAAFNNAVSRVAGLAAIAGLGVVLTLPYQNALTERIDTVSLSHAERTQIEQLSQDPVSGLEGGSSSAQVERLVETSYTAGFRTVMVVRGLLALSGGAIAFFTIRDSPSSEDGTS